MINDQLKISLPFYNEILKQTRYKNECASVCDFQLLQPPDLIPPFQLRFGAEETSGIFAWNIRCADDDSILYDLTSHIVNIDFELKSEFEFYTYSGLVFEEINFSCGSYYMEIQVSSPVDSPPVTQTSWFSEVFTVVDSLTDLAFTQSEFPLPNLWRWYNDIDKQTRYKNECAVICDFYLFSGNENLIPFQFRFPYLLPIAYSIIWSLISVSDDCETFLDASMLTVTTIGGYNYITYTGDAIDLSCGKFYSKINIDGQIFYSELIWIIDEADNTERNYLLQETGFKILQETGFGILI